jgi:hypothetical protein
MEKRLFVTSARIEKCELEFDMLSVPLDQTCTKLGPNNFRFEVEIVLKLTSSGDFSNENKFRLQNKILKSIANNFKELPLCSGPF